MTNYYVDATRPDDTGNGLSWATAKKTFAGVAGAISVANPGDTINVASGTYTEVATSISWTKNNLTFLGPNAGINPVTNLAGRGPEAIIKFQFSADNVNCIVDGLKFDSVPTSAYGSIYMNGTTATITVAIRNCIFTGVCAQYVVRVVGTVAFPMSNSVFENNRVENWTTVSPPPTLRNSVWYVRGSGTVFQGNLISNPPVNVIGPNLYGSTNVQVLNNTFEGFGTYAPALNINGSELPTHDYTVAGNTFRNCGAEALCLRIMGLSVYNVNVTANLFENCKNDVWLRSTPTPAPAPTIKFDNIVISGNTFRRNTDGTVDKMASLLIQLSQPGAVGDVAVTSNTFDAYGTYSAGQKEFYGISVEGNSLTTLMVAGNSFAGLSNIGVLVPDSAGVLFRTNSATYGLLGIANIEMSQNVYSGFDNGIGIFDDVGVAYGNLPVGVAIGAHFENFSSSLTYGVRSGTGAVADATNSFWADVSGPSGGVADPVTGVLANGTGVLVSTFVHFDPWATNGVIPSTPPDLYPQGGVPVYTDGSTRYIPKPGINAAWMQYPNSGGGNVTLKGRNSGVGCAYNDRIGRFENPGKT